MSGEFRWLGCSGCSVFKVILSSSEGHFVMNQRIKEMRELLLQAKPIDFSNRPATLILPQGQTYTLVLMSLPLLVLWGYEFFKDWNEGKLAYEYLALAGVSLFWSVSQVKHILSRYEIIIDTEEVRFTRKYLFSIMEKWKTPLSQYQALELAYISGERPADSMYSVNLVHPDPSRSLPLAASQQEAMVRGQLDQLKIALSLPVIDKAAARPNFSQNEKKATRAFWTRPGAVILLLMVVLPIGLMGWYFWTLSTSPMKSTACTIVNHEITGEEKPQPDGRNQLLTTHYRYIYEGQSYLSGYKIGRYESKEKMQRWISKRPEGTETNCFVDSREPTRVVENPFPKAYWDGMVYMTMGVTIVGLLLVIWNYFPLGFKREPQTICERITQRNAKDKVKNRYRQTILELKTLGFQGYCFYREIMSAFSLLAGFQMFLMMMWKREIVTIRFPLRMVLSFPLLALPNQGTYAMTHGLETKFLTLFTDGTALVTGTEGQVPAFVDEERQLYRQGSTQTVTEAWQQHRDRISVFKAEGKQEKPETRFEDYVEIETRTEKVILDNHFFHGA